MPFDLCGHLHTHDAQKLTRVDVNTHRKCVGEMAQEVKASLRAEFSLWNTHGEGEGCPLNAICTLWMSIFTPTHTWRGGGENRP